LNKRKWILGIASVILLWGIYPALRVFLFLIIDPIPEDKKIHLDDQFLDDASGLNETRHAGIFRVSRQNDSNLTALKNLVLDAGKTGKKLIPIGARHSMGKQSLFQGSVHVDLSGLNEMKIEGDLLRAGAGARWKDILKYLAPIGLSVEIMQSNADFSVGGTLSVNAHGWQPNRPPVSSSVHQVSVLTKDGTIETCSRDQNSELFKHIMGGYGMFGIILEAWIKPVPNEILQSSHKVVKVEKFTENWNAMKKNNTRLAFGRLSVSESNFFDQVLLTSYQPTGEISKDNPQYIPTFKNSLARAIFRASLNSPRGKSFRQSMENLLGGEAGGVHSRANLMIEPVRIFSNNDADKTDLLLEVFIPQEKFAEFTNRAKDVLEHSSGNLLNVTVREITKDNDSVLSYAKTDVFGLVMLFTIKHQSQEEARLSKQAQSLYDLSIELGGSFYLTYRNFAQPAQVLAAYPELPKFMEAKMKWDPEEIFYSGFYQYLKSAR
jgi:hypothetical protein